MLATAVVMINFFIIISPIMIPMILIGSTKKFFDKWLNTLIGYSLQPFLVLALISLLLLLIDYFYGYIAVIYDYDVTYIQNNNLGINMPRIDDLNTSDSIAYLLQFLFLLIVIIHIFDKFAQILSHLSGAGSVTNIVQAPNFEGQLKKGVKFIGKNIKRSAAATASAAGLASSAKKSGQGEGKDQENDVGNENRNINSESNSLGQDGSSSDGQGGSSNQNVQ
jgi:type IV secretory pathway VirB6-like protein